MRDIIAPPSASFGDREFCAPASSKGSRDMTQYQAYIIDSDDQFKNSVMLECSDDEVALKRAKQLVGGHHIELWQYTRKIATLDHNGHRVE
jgi:hypothetical protein